MISLWRIFSLELTAFWRSKAAIILLGLSILWVIVSPLILIGDGTVSGNREVVLKYGLGGVAILLALSLTITATGSLAKERAEKRLQLTMVRPVTVFTIAVGKYFALLVISATILGLAMLVEMGMVAEVRDCRHVQRPLLPSVQESAERMYDYYMKSPQTPESIKKTNKAALMRILTQKEVDRYVSIKANDSVTWRFEELTGDLTVRLRFTNKFDMREDVRGRLSYGHYEGVVSNITQAVVEIPLKHGTSSNLVSALKFENNSKGPVMLRPRKDVEILSSADSFYLNAFRAYLELVSLLALLIAFGLMLGGALSRPVAVFVAIVVLILSEMTPSVAEQYPDSVDTSRIDQLGLVFTRFAAEVTHPISSVNPLEALALDECIEWRELIQTFSYNVIFIPLLLLILTGILMPIKQEG